MRNAEDVMKFTSNKKPKFNEVLKQRTGKVKDLAYGSQVRLEWDFSEESTKHQVIRLEIEGKDGQTAKAAVAVQDLEHYLRAT